MLNDLYFNPLEHLLEDNEADNRSVHLFSLESLGTKKDNRKLVSFNKNQNDKFKKALYSKMDTIM